MTQETTEAFGTRFEQAVEGHPSAPATPHGRQKWMLDKLAKETGLTVSANTMSKWMHGQSKPRADNIRKIAQVLRVDEVWLSLGRKPVIKAGEMEINVGRAKGAVLAVAGLIEMSGGRVSFHNDSDTVADIHVNSGGASFEAIVVTPNIQGDVWTFLITEPVGNCRVLGVTMPTKTPVGKTACICVLDLTDVPRQSLGGYSVVKLEKRKDGRFKVDGEKPLMSALAGLEELGVA